MANFRGLLDPVSPISSARGPLINYTHVNRCRSIKFGKGNTFVTDRATPRGISGLSGLARGHAAVKEFQYLRTVSVQPSSMPSAPSIAYAISFTNACSERKSYGDASGFSRTNLSGLVSEFAYGSGSHTRATSLAVSDSFFPFQAQVSEKLVCHQQYQCLVQSTSLWLCEEFRWGFAFFP